ncbi:hypothetical protein [Listeria phage LMTA-34]|uniref:Uncharacterized protein n=1 Tax=Listeria phage LMTA-34 TaxID=1486397 RepID=A0A076G748_9CAUD|nr:hypothetical protein [Listeria phage LMTA-34]
MINIETTSTVGYWNIDTFSYEYMYCATEGEPWSIGTMLTEYYTDYKQVRQLMQDKEFGNKKFSFMSSKVNKATNKKKLKDKETYFQYIFEKGQWFCVYTKGFMANVEIPAIENPYRFNKWLDKNASKLTKKRVKLLRELVVSSSEVKEETERVVPAMVKLEPPLRLLLDDTHSVSSHNILEFLKAGNLYSLAKREFYVDDYGTEVDCFTINELTKPSSQVPSQIMVSKEHTSNWYPLLDLLIDCGYISDYVVEDTGSNSKEVKIEIKEGG